MAKSSLLQGWEMGYLAEHFGLDPDLLESFTIIARRDQPVMIETVQYVRRPDGAPPTLAKRNFHAARADSEELTDG